MLRWGRLGLRQDHVSTTLASRPMSNQNRRVRCLRQRARSRSMPPSGSSAVSSPSRVEEDALIGSLTVRETCRASRPLSSTSSLPKRERIARIDALLDAFGLREQSNTLIGTPIRKGTSGGQKRRWSVSPASSSRAPRSCFLDEPTSGLDSAASWEVLNYLEGHCKTQQGKLVPGHRARPLRGRRAWWR